MDVVGCRVECRRDCAGGEPVTGWVLVVVGALCMFAPGFVDPFAPINGLSLVGLLLVVWGTVRMNRGGTQ